MSVRPQCQCADLECPVRHTGRGVFPLCVYPGTFLVTDQTKSGTKPTGGPVQCDRCSYAITEDGPWNREFIHTEETLARKEAR